MTRKLTPENKKRFANLREMGCIICSNPEVHIHHKLGSGMGQKSSDKDTYSLCWRHHTGDEGIHTLGVKTWQKKFGRTEDELLAVTNDLLGLMEMIS